MGVLVQIRDVPEDVHRQLKSRAAAAGLSLSEYLRRVLEQNARRLTPEEFAREIRAQGSVELSEPSEVTVRDIRDRGAD